jgi:hypothetical protein
MRRGALLFAISLASAGSATADDGIDRRTLTAKEVSKYFEPYRPAVKACYIDHATNKTAQGILRLELIIHRDGKVQRFGYAAPGVVKPWSDRLDRCLRALVSTWSFPVRRGFTSAVIPFTFVRTHAPDAGPYESCWDPRGCPPGKEKRS